MAAVLVRAEHASRHLSVDATDEVVVVVCGLEGSLVAAHQIPGGRLAEALGHVDVVPVGQTAFLHPVGRAAVYLPGKLEQEGLARAVVEPDDGEQVVAAAAVLPVVAQELLVGVLELPFVVGCEDGQHALVAAPLVVVLQDLQRQHVCPQLAASVLVLVDGAEETVCLTAAQDALDPELRLVEQRLVVQDVSEVGVAAEPVRHFFPAVAAAGFEPRVALLVEPVADFSELSAQSVLLPQEHLAHPSAGGDGGGSGQRSPVVDVERGGGLDFVGRHHARFLCRERQMQHHSCPKEGIFSIHSVKLLNFACKGTTFFANLQTIWAFSCQNVSILRAAFRKPRCETSCCRTLQAEVFAASR